MPWRRACVSGAGGCRTFDREPIGFQDLEIVTQRSRSGYISEVAPVSDFLLPRRLLLQGKGYANKYEHTLGPRQMMRAAKPASKLHQLPSLDLSETVSSFLSGWDGGPGADQ